jgi:hypothetical protein
MFYPELFLIVMTRCKSPTAKKVTCAPREKITCKGSVLSSIRLH